MLDSLLDDDYEQNSESYNITPLEGLKEPRHSDVCLGHQNIEKQILDLYHNGQMPHAVIFSGPRGIGKSTFAFRTARFLLKHGLKDSNQGGLFGDALPTEPLTTLDVAKDDPVFSKIAAGGHPDLITIERAIDPRKGTIKEALDVDTARKVTPFLRMTPSEGGWRVVIIDDADTMNRNAQNALLKILEEPPKNTLLILIAHRIGAMIPTIRSRCRTMTFQSLSHTDMDKLLDKVAGAALSGDQKAMIMAMAEGQIGKAIDLYENEGLETLQSLIALCASWPDMPWVDIHHLADQIGRAGQENAYMAFEQFFLWMTSTMTFAKAKGENALQKPLYQGVFSSMMAHYSLEQWLNICENLKEHFERARYANLDKRQAVLAAFSYLDAN